nr:putative RNA-directed DNA polymerase, eukaryota, reverse transcriptase zinc-binding domain protein [Tanacetum cinerariifolium]
MQEERNQFKRLDVWVLVERAPDKNVIKEASKDDDDILDKLSLDSRFGEGERSLSASPLPADMKVLPPGKMSPQFVDFVFVVKNQTKGSVDDDDDVLDKLSLDLRRKKLPGEMVLSAGFSSADQRDGFATQQNEDPLSPFLFIIIMEGLHVVLQNAVYSGLILGAMIGNSGYKLSHLFYAVDVVIIFEWNHQDMDNIIHVLLVFFLALGLKINVSKSNVFRIEVSLHDIEDMTCDTGCGSGSVLNSLEAMRASFFWGGSGEKKKIAWFKW